MSSIDVQIISSVVIVVMALSVIFIRLKAAKHPTNARKILIPPLGMSTGFLMFVAKPTHIPVSYGIAAFLVGMLFSIPLIASSKFYKADGEIYLHRSRGFMFVLLALVVIRLALHGYIEQYVSLVQTGAVFFILAFGMLLPWRIAMYLRYRKLIDSVSFSSVPDKPAES